MSHGAARRLAAAAALDDLGPRERARWASHRAACPDCRHLEAELDGVLADLALVVPARVPSPSVLAGILAAIRPDVEASATP